MKIPIQNIYYLLCYAWDKLEEGEKNKVNKDNFTKLRIMINKSPLS